MALTYSLFILTGIQGYWHLSWIPANHPSLGLLTIIVYLLTETLVMFFFIGTGISVKEYAQEHNSSQKFRQRMIRLKNKVFPPMMLNIFLVGFVFILGGAVDTHMVPGWTHGVLFWIVLIHFSKLIILQHQAFRENTFIILEMAGVDLPNNDTA